MEYLFIHSVFLELDILWINDHYELFFRSELVYLLVVIPFALFVFEQISFLSSRLITKSRVKITPKKDNKNNLIVLLYIGLILLTFLIAVSQYMNVFSNSFPIWLVFSIISQITFSYLLFKNSFLFLTTEVPLLFLIISEGGIAIYAKKFIKTIEFSDQLIAGYLKALDLLGSNVLPEVGNVNSIKFQEKSSLLVRNVRYGNSKCKFCYIHQGISYLAEQRLESLINEIEDNKELENNLMNCIINNKVLAVSETIEIAIEKSFFEK